MRFLILIGSLFLLTAFSTSEPQGFSDEKYHSYTWQSFRRLPQARDTLDLYDPDYELLGAAIFYMTNQARAKKGLAPLRFDPRLRDAALLHSGQMAHDHFVDHYHPRSKKYRSPADRAKLVGADLAAENVASSFLYRYRSNTHYYPRTVSGKRQFYTSSGQLIVRHTYLGFAERIVRNWLESPGHRRNILHRDLKRLGCAVRYGEGEVASGQMPLAYSTQNFGY
ncbi:MAG: CAP domain-containing protein [Bacteroidota bacterium]